MPRITELQLPKFMRVAYCYVRDKGVVKLYDDEPMPRVHIATISGNDLDGWQWQAVVPIIRYDNNDRSAHWRGAVVDAALRHYSTNK